MLLNSNIVKLEAEPTIQDETEAYVNFAAPAYKHLEKKKAE
jgi:hypothetical protein